MNIAQDSNFSCTDRMSVMTWTCSQFLFHIFYLTCSNFYFTYCIKSDVTKTNKNNPPKKAQTPPPQNPLKTFLIVALSKPEKLLMFWFRSKKWKSHKHNAFERMCLLSLYECIVQCSYISVHIQTYFKIEMYALEIAKSDNAKRMSSETLNLHYFAEKACSFF